MLGVVLAQARQLCVEGDVAGGWAMLEDRLSLEERMTNRLLGCSAVAPVRMPESEEFRGFLTSG